MQAYDLIMLIVLGMATLFGAIKGFAWQMASLASIVVSYFVAYRFRFQVAEMIEATPPWNQFLAMLILYVGTSFVIWVGFRLLSGAIDKVRLKEFDRHLGAAFGLAKGVIFCLLITMFAMSLLGPNQQSAICQSKSGYYIATALDRGVGILPQEIHQVVGPYLAHLDNKLKNGQQGNPSEATDGFGFPASLDRLQQGMPSLPGSIADSLPNLPIPGMGDRLVPSSGQEAGWPWNELNAGTGFPAVDPKLNNPGTFPPLNPHAGQIVPGDLNAIAPTPEAYPPGLRPAGGGAQQQAQQPGLLLPR